MPKVSLISLQEVQEALDRYRSVVEQSELRPLSKQTYLLHADQFVRWLADDFIPGETAMRRRRGR